MEKKVRLKFSNGQIKYALEWSFPEDTPDDEAVMRARKDTGHTDIPAHLTDEVSIRVEEPAAAPVLIPQKFNVFVKAWDKSGTELGSTDLSDLKPGMLVKDIFRGDFREVVGSVTEDEFDWVIPLDNGEYYSSLMLE